ncbi:MAG: hypothetical protein ACOCP8_10335 [archaeon]
MYNLKLKNNDIYLNINNDDGKELQEIFDQVLTLSRLLNYKVVFYQRQHLKKNTTNEEYHICIENNKFFFDIYIDVFQVEDQYSIYSDKWFKEGLSLKQFINKLQELLLHIK